METLLPFIAATIAWVVAYRYFKNKKEKGKIFSHFLGFCASFLALLTVVAIIAPSPQENKQVDSVTQQDPTATVATVEKSQKSKSTTRVIHKKDYGEKWAFTTEKAVLKCFKDGDIISPVVELDGKNFGLTGFADNMYGQKDLDAFNPYWLKHPTFDGLRIDIGIFQKEAEALCQ